MYNDRTEGNILKVNQFRSQLHPYPKKKTPKPKINPNLHTSLKDPFFNTCKPFFVRILRAGVFKNTKFTTSLQMQPPSPLPPPPSQKHLCVKSITIIASAVVSWKHRTRPHMNASFHTNMFLITLGSRNVKAKQVAWNAEMLHECISFRWMEDFCLTVPTHSPTFRIILHSCLK